MVVELKKAICGICHSRCRVVVEVSDGRVLGSKPDLEHPHGGIFKTLALGCPRQQAIAEYFHHPDRLNYPLKRIGERGENKWQRISWEQAWDDIAARLAEIREKHGAEAVAFHSGDPSTQEPFRARFQYLLGSPNTFSDAQVCFASGNMISAAMYGCLMNLAAVRPGVTKSILLLGTDPSVAARRLWYHVLEAKKKGAKLIVVDPRRTTSAANADIWLQLRPGTDAALLMGLINVIITEELYDREFVEKWCHGFDELALRAKDYPAEKVAEVTWVPAEKIRDAARTYATCRPGASQSAMGLEMIGPNSAASLQARFILPAITGNVDIRGGQLIRGRHPMIVPMAEIEGSHMLSPTQKRKQIGADQSMLFSWECY